MKYIRKAALISLLVLMISCKHRDVQKDKQSSFCFVYCDFTNSMDSAAHEKVIQDALQIFKAYHATDTIRFFSLDANSFSKPICEFSPPKPGLKSKMQTQTEAASIESKKASLTRALYDTWHRTDSTGTCIIKNIKQAIHDCNNISYNNQVSFKLIFLSDMLESCDSINLENWDEKENDRYNNAISILTRDTNWVSFPVTQEFKVAIVVSASSNVSKEKRINIDLHQKFWETVFSKCQYRGPRIDLGSSIPWSKLAGN